MATLTQKELQNLEVQAILAKWAMEAATIDNKAKEPLLAPQPGPGWPNTALTEKNVQQEAVDPVPKKTKSPFGLTKRVAKPATPIRYLNPSTSPEEKSMKSSPSMPPMTIHMDFEEDLDDLF